MKMQIKSRWNRMAYRHGVAAVIAGAVFSLAGCASVPPPKEQLAVSKAAVENASTADSTEFAPVELRAAREKLSEAERAMADKDYARARRLAEEAEVDARLAQTKASSAKAEKAVAEAQEANRVLREELERANQNRGQ